MALEDDMAVLGCVSLFSNLTGEHLRLIAFGAEPFELAEGRLLCRAGEIADGGFVLVSGTMARLAGLSQTVENRFSAAGTLFGELSLLTRCAWQSTLVATTTCRMLRVPRPLFRRIIEEYPETAFEIEKSLSAELSNNVQKMEIAAKRLG